MKKKNETRAVARHYKSDSILGDEEREQKSCRVTSKRPRRNPRCLERNLG